MTAGKGSIRFFASAAEAEGEPLHGATVVVIDVLRATSTIITAIERGAARVLPVESVETATRLVSLSDRGDKLLAGEHKGLPIEGFDLFNSPSELIGHDVAGRTVILATTNGTPAIASASLKARRVLICALMNVDAVAEEASRYDDLVILCCGNSGSIAGEDLLCAGLLLESMSWPADFGHLGDSASLALMLSGRCGGDIEGYVRTTERGRRLLEIGYEGDVILCSRRGSSAKTLHVRQGSIEP